MLVPWMHETRIATFFTSYLYLLLRGLLVERTGPPWHDWNAEPTRTYRGHAYRLRIPTFFVTVTSFPVTAYFLRSTGELSTRLVIGVP